MEKDKELDKLIKTMQKEVKEELKEEFPVWGEMTKKQRKEIAGKLKELFKLRTILGINKIEEELNQLKEAVIYKSKYTGYLG